MNNLKSILWAIVGIVIFIAVVKFFIFLLPFIIVIGLISYIIIKARKTFDKKNNSSEKYNSYSQNKSVFEESASSNDTGEIIDVDYREVDK